MADKLNSGVKSILSKFKDGCIKLKLLEGNEELCNQIQYILKTEGENNDYATKILNLEESLKNEQLFYLNKTGISSNALPKNIQLETASKILQEAGIDDYNSDSLFTKYMSMIEMCNKQKNIIDDIDEHINKLKLEIEQQNDLRCELSNITYIPIGYTAEPIDIKPIEKVKTVNNYEEIVELVKKISDIKKKQIDICKETSELKSEQQKMFHGLPPNMDHANMAVQIAEQTMKSMSKKLVEKIGQK